MTSITEITNKIIQREFKIDELSRKRGVFSNNICNIKRHKYKLKPILKECRKVEIALSLV